jgi:hypothetical protein
MNGPSAFDVARSNVAHRCRRMLRPSLRSAAWIMDRHAVAARSEMVASNQRRAADAQ